MADKAGFWPWLSDRTIEVVQTNVWPWLSDKIIRVRETIQVVPPSLGSGPCEGSMTENRLRPETGYEPFGS